MEWITIGIFAVGLFAFTVGHLGCFFAMQEMDADLRSHHKVARLNTGVKIINLAWYLLGMVGIMMVTYQAIDIFDIPMLVEVSVPWYLNDGSWAILSVMWIISLTHGFTRYLNTEIAQGLEETAINFTKNLYLRNPNL
jgi:hypothetical protein